MENKDSILLKCKIGVQSILKKDPLPPIPIAIGRGLRVG